jgi:hypothetical protein
MVGNGKNQVLIALCVKLTTQHFDQGENMP